MKKAKIISLHTDKSYIIEYDEAWATHGDEAVTFKTNGLYSHVGFEGAIILLDYEDDLDKRKLIKLG